MPLHLLELPTDGGASYTSNGAVNIDATGQVSQAVVTLQDGVNTISFTNGNARRLQNYYGVPLYVILVQGGTGTGTVSIAGLQAAHWLQVGAGQALPALTTTPAGFDTWLITFLSDTQFYLIGYS